MSVSLIHSRTRIHSLMKQVTVLMGESLNNSCRQLVHEHYTSCYQMRYGLFCCGFVVRAKIDYVIYKYNVIIGRFAEIFLETFAFTIFDFRSTHIDDLKANRLGLKSHTGVGAKLLQDRSCTAQLSLTVLTECKCVIKVSLI